LPVEHEYIVCFAKNKNSVEKIWKSRFSEVKDLLIRIGDEFVKAHADQSERQIAYTQWFRANRNELWPLDRYKYIDSDGIYTGSQSVHNPGREGYRYDVVHPETGKPCKQPLMGYRFPEETMRELLAHNKILFGDDHTKIIELKVYAKDFLDKLPSVIEIDGRTAAYELRDIFPERKKAFDNPKPTQLVDKILSFAAQKDALVLDSFAGSGTTAHSVLNLNSKDGGARRFILVEGEDYADELTRERIARVMRGQPKTSPEAVNADLGREFTYCTLGEPVELDKVLSGESLPSYPAIGAALFHMATNLALDPKAIRPKEFYLGETESQHIWLIYKPILDWLKAPEAALTLARAKAFAEAKPGKRHLVFAPARFVSQKMLADQNVPVEFVPLPFALYRIERS
jgi:adenine-specific DNA-methyltransferase